MKLKKEITLLGVFSIASGAMISSGIFILPGLAYAKVGSWVFLTYLLAGIFAFLGIISVTELATAMPKAGGDYYFINKTFGGFFGTISGLMGWTALLLKSAFAIFGITEILYLYTGINPLISGLFLCLFFIGINILGVKEAVNFQILMVIGLFILMLIYIIFGFKKIHLSFFDFKNIIDFNKIIKTSGFIFISFGGLLTITNVSEEVVNPKKDIPLGIFFSIIVVTIFYTLLTFIVTGTLSPVNFRNSLTPVADSARIVMGNFGFIIIIIASLLAFFTTANSGIMSASRYLMALSRDKLIPDIFSFISKKYHTPVITIILTGVVIYFSLLLSLEVLVKVASTIILSSYVLTNISVIIFRESKIVNYKPSFKSPLYPYLQIFSVIVFIFFIIDLGLESIEISLSFIVLCIIIYSFYGRKKKNKTNAFLYLLKRIVDKELIDNSIEDELREIIINRDNIKQDNFDLLIKNAELINIDRQINFKELLLTYINPIISKKTGVSEKVINNLFLEREKEVSFVVNKFLAIPHVVIEGNYDMFLIIVRCKNGIEFSEKFSKIKALFFLIGNKSHRILHLKTLASIATLTGIKKFKQNWIELEDSVKLKNLLLLNRRKRFY